MREKVREAKVPLTMGWAVPRPALGPGRLSLELTSLWVMLCKTAGGGTAEMSKQKSRLFLQVTPTAGGSGGHKAGQTTNPK